jgi:hypothetical protein
MSEKEPIEVFEGLWQMQSFYSDRRVSVEVQTPRGKSEYRLHSDPFRTSHIWDYADVSRYIVLDVEPRRKMLEGGDEEVVCRNVGSHNRGPDDIDHFLEPRRKSQHVIGLEVSSHV